jgi:hypothetical protein
VERKKIYGWGKTTEFLIISDWYTLYTCMKIEQGNLLKCFKKGGGWEWWGGESNIGTL